MWLASILFFNSLTILYTLAHDVRGVVFVVVARWLCCCSNVSRRWSALLWALMWLCRPIRERQRLPQRSQSKVGPSWGAAAAALARSRFWLALNSSSFLVPSWMDFLKDGRDCADASKFEMPKRLAECFRVSRYPSFASSPYSTCWGRRELGIRITWPVHRSYDDLTHASALDSPDLLKTSSLVTCSLKWM